MAILLIYAHKKGEEAVPAGGETGIPHYLAEVRKPLIQQYLRNIQKLNLF
jgi:hypothetical protein